jgi:hypothetical protein
MNDDWNRFGMECPLLFVLLGVRFSLLFLRFDGRKNMKQEFELEYMNALFIGAPEAVPFFANPTSRTIAHRTLPTVYVYVHVCCVCGRGQSRTVGRHVTVV